jgi:hypothetical protein
MIRGKVGEKRRTEAAGAIEAPAEDRAAIARRAYEIYVERGAGPARAFLEDRFRAEAELLKLRP